MSRSNPVLVLTIGHSVLTAEAFIQLLTSNGVQCVADIRTVPCSRRNPQFNSDTLEATLAEAAMSYVHLAELGGLRRAERDSANTGWRNATFRGFADYMQTAGFDKGLKSLIRLADKRQTAIMCAEAVPWRCHRSLVADALLVRGMAVEHILGKSSRRPHVLTPWASVVGTRITYPPTQPPSGADSDARNPWISSPPRGRGIR